MYVFKTLIRAYVHTHLTRVPKFSALDSGMCTFFFFFFSKSFSFVPPVLDKFIPEYLGPEFKMIGFSFPSRGFIYSYSIINYLWMPYICIISPPFPLGYPKLHTAKTKCTMFPSSKLDHSLTYHISVDQKELYKLSPWVIFGSPTIHPTTQWFSSSLPFTYLILLFHCYHHCLGSYIYVFCFFFNNHSPSLPTAAS